jgi:hypothetical protein
MTNWKWKVAGIPVIGAIVVFLIYWLTRSNLPAGVSTTVQAPGGAQDATGQQPASAVFKTGPLSLLPSPELHFTPAANDPSFNIGGSPLYMTYNQPKYDTAIYGPFNIVAGDLKQPPAANDPGLANRPPLTGPNPGSPPAPVSGGCGCGGGGCGFTGPQQDNTFPDGSGATVIGPPGAFAMPAAQFQAYINNLNSVGA